MKSINQSFTTITNKNESDYIHDNNHVNYNYVISSYFTTTAAAAKTT